MVLLPAALIGIWFVAVPWCAKHDPLKLSTTVSETNEVMQLALPIEVSHVSVQDKMEIYRKGYEDGSATGLAIAISNGTITWPVEWTKDSLETIKELR